MSQTAIAVTTIRRDRDQVRATIWGSSARHERRERQEHAARCRRTARRSAGAPGTERQRRETPCADDRLSRRSRRWARTGEHGREARCLASPPGEAPGRRRDTLPGAGLQTVPVTSPHATAWRDGRQWPETQIAFTELLGRRVRMGTWEDQKISTYRKIREALDEGRWDNAAELGRYFIDEAKVCFTLYRQWIADLAASSRPGAWTRRRSATQRPGGRGRPSPRRLARGTRASQWDRFLSEMQADDGRHLPRAARGGQARCWTSPRRRGASATTATWTTRTP